MRKIVRLFIVCLLFQTSLLAQIPGFTQFSINNGLPSNTVYDITQDENGFIWIATDYGLSRFDGLTFKNFTIDDGLPDNEILSLFIDSNKRIWLTGFNGRMGYIQNEKLFSYNNQPYLKNLSFNNFVSNVFEDSHKNIWFFASLTNIKKLDSENNVTSYDLSSSLLKIRFITLQIVEDIKGTVKILVYAKKPNNIRKQILSSSFLNPKWEVINLDLYSQKTINSLRNGRPEVFKNIDSISMQISNTIFNHYHYDESSNLLYQSLSFGDSFLITNLNNGVLLLNSKDKYKNKKLLSYVHSTRSFLDNENNIWLGSQSNGIFLFPNLNISGVQFDDSKRNDFYSVSIFKNNLVVGNEQSEITILNAETLQAKTSFKLGGNQKRIVNIKSHENQLYILSETSIFKLESNLTPKKIKDMYDTDFQNLRLTSFKDFSFNGDFIYTANANGVAKINKTSFLSKKLWDKRSTSICYTTKDSLWIGTTKGLYLHINDNTKKYDLGEEFNNSIIYALENFKNGLLIGSNSYGLGFLRNGIFKKISIKEGLISNYIKSIFIDTKNTIWICTNLGLNNIELDKNNNIKPIKSYTTSDGLYSNDVRDCYVENNKVYVATSKGLNIIDLSKDENSILAPRIHINEVLLNNTSIEKTNNQAFDHELNNIQFNFSGISFKSLGNIKFEYRLLGLEPDWIETKNNTVRYSSLPPNSYTFEVKAISKNNLESSNSSIFTFTIKPPIYKTWWFISLATFALLLFIAYLFYNRNQKIKRNEKIKENISNLRYKALNAQMNPHFINNLLVNIENLVNKGELEEVKGSLSKFAELVNLILQSTKSNLINLTDEIEMAKLYLELQKLRFHKNTSYTINTASIPQDELENILVPPMILQPIIENSFKHGFKEEHKTNHIIVNFNIVDDEFLICQIIDNGVGIQKSDNSSTSSSSEISFSNINERLQLINESKSEENLVIISNVTDEFNTLVGLKVTLKIPLISF